MKNNFIYTLFFLISSLVTVGAYIIVIVFAKEGIGVDTLIATTVAIVILISVVGLWFRASPKNNSMYFKIFAIISMLFSGILLIFFILTVPYILYHIAK